MTAAARRLEPAAEPELGPVPVTALYTVKTAANPQALPRLLGLFAQQDLAPAAVRMLRRGDELVVTIRQPELSEHRATVIVEKMRAMVLVRSAGLECLLERTQRPRALAAA